MGRKSKKKGGKKSSDKGGKKGNAAAASKPKSVSEFAAGLKARSAEFKELLSNEEKLKGLSEDDLALCHALHVSTMLKVAELGGDLDEESHAASLKYCEENATKVFEDGGVGFRRRLAVQVEKRKEKKKFEEDMEELKQKGDEVGRLRLLQARMRAEGMEEHCGDLLHCTLIDDELFADPPPQPECPICMLTLPGSGRITYQPCCGKILCDGCMFAHRDASGIDRREYACPFCRVPQRVDRIKLTRKRAEGNCPEAMYMLAQQHLSGSHGLRKDCSKALELFERAADLGLPMANHTLGIAYERGVLGLDKDAKKAMHHLRLSAIGGEAESRFSLGMLAYESRPQNMDLATKHWIIAAEAGHDRSLSNLKLCYQKGLLAKDVFAKVLRDHQAACDEMRSEQRDRALKDRDMSVAKAVEERFRRGDLN